MSSELPEVPAGDSAEQRRAETDVLNLLSRRIGVPLVPQKIALSEKTHVEVDGVSDDPPILAEVWAHQGPLRGGQPNKVMVDALKMLYVEAATGRPYRKIFCFTDEAARKPFLGRSWRAAALAHYGIELLVIQISDELRDLIIRAQTRQYR